MESASLTTGQRVSRRSARTGPQGGNPARADGTCPVGNAWVPQGAPRARSGGKSQEGRSSGDGGPGHPVRQHPEAPPEPRLSRGAVEEKCVGGSRRRRRGRRNGENLGGKETQESNGPSAERQFRGVRTRRGEETPEAAKNRVRPDKPQSGRMRLLETAGGERRREARGSPARMKAL